MCGRNAVVKKLKTNVKNTKIKSVWEKQRRKNKKQGTEETELSLWMTEDTSVKNGKNNHSSPQKPALVLRL